LGFVNILYLCPTMKYFFKLIRIQNLLIIALTQYAIRFAIIIPILKSGGYSSQFGELNFLLMVLSTCFLTAAGYAINDYFDIKTDTMNRPKRVVAGKHIERRSVMQIHILFSVLGIILGFYLGWAVGMIKLGFVHVLIAALLWYYSAALDKKYLTGNILVALMTAAVPLMTILYEIPVLYSYYGETLVLMGQNFNTILFWVLGFSGFAFITTLSREIIKDTEDFEGDAAYGRQTLPVVSGVKVSKIVSSSIIFVTITSLIYLFFKYIFCVKANATECLKYDYLSLVYIFVLIIFPSIFLIYKVLKADSQQEWHTASLISKIIMLTGILYSGVILFNFS